MARLQETLGLNPNHVRSERAIGRHSHLPAGLGGGEARAVLGRLYEDQPASGPEARLVAGAARPGRGGAWGRRATRAVRTRPRGREKERLAASAKDPPDLESTRRPRRGRAVICKAALDAYRTAGLSGQEAEVVRALRERTLVAAPGRGAAVWSWRSFMSEALGARSQAGGGALRTSGTGLPIWSASREGRQDWRRLINWGSKHCGAGARMSRFRSLPSVVARRLDYKDALSLLHTLVSDGHCRTGQGAARGESGSHAGRGEGGERGARCGGGRDARREQGTDAGRVAVEEARTAAEAGKVDLNTVTTELR